MATIEIGQETESRSHWTYEVRVFDGRIHLFRVSLSFADYDLWSHGRVPPSRVVEAVFEFLLQNEPADQILPKFDCSTVRRHFQSLDTELPGLL
jgi:hypothetical protein